MSAEHAAITAAEQVVTTSDWVKAGATVAASLLLVFVLDRLFKRRGKQLAEAVTRGELSQEVDTRLRLLRRILYAVIILIGVANAITYFTGITRLVGSLLASGALAAAILGFAARQTLANFIAGIMLAVTQPIRVGDWVFFEDQYGVVEDIRLNYTFLRTLGDQQVVIPNERLATGIMRNDTLGDGVVGLDVAVWIPPTTDAARAIAVLHDETGQSVSVAEVTDTGVRLAVGGDPTPPPERAPREAELRLQCLTRLRAEGLLPEPGRPE